MTTLQYESLTPREATPSAASRLFAFYRYRGASEKRFYPGDGAKLHFANRDVDTLELPGVPGGYLAAGDVVTAVYKGVTVFRGDVARIVEHRARGTDATQTVTCVGPWSKMQRMVYRQYWYDGSALVKSSRLVLNQYHDGTAQNLNGELREIANHAKTACGYTVGVGDISVSAQQLPFDECRDITVADAIKRELRFFPSAVVYFDYSGATPAIKIKKPSAAASAAYVASVPKTQREYVYNAHPITGVDLEIAEESDGNRIITHKTAGDTTADNPDCLYATLQLRGASANATYQSFVSVTEDEPSSYNDVSWWKAKHPRLANVAASAITITDGTKTYAAHDYPRIAAASAGEIEAAGLHCEVAQYTCKATIATADDVEEDIYLTLNFLTTDARGTADDPKTYTWLAESSATSGESVPEGLAAAILAERSGTLQSERMTVRLGDTMPKIGDAIVETPQTLPAIQTAQTLFLQQIDIDCANLTADLSFGVPEYLTPEDMASLLSGFRNRCTSSSATIRKTGKMKDAGTNVEMGGIQPLSSSEFAPGTKAKTTIRSASGSGGSISLDASEVDGTIGAHTLTDGDANGFQLLADGDVRILGGRNVRVTISGKTIRISYEEGKEPDPEPGSPDTPSDPCDHPGGGEGSDGGVAADDADHGGAAAGGEASGGAGGVASEGDAHPGEACNCEG